MQSPGVVSAVRAAIEGDEERSFDDAMPAIVNVFAGFVNRCEVNQ
jgi:hypothetical protein